jgi:hypothetical protein
MTIAHGVLHRPRRPIGVLRPRRRLIVAVTPQRPDRPGIVPVFVPQNYRFLTPCRHFRPQRNAATAKLQRLFQHSAAQPSIQSP